MVRSGNRGFKIVKNGPFKKRAIERGEIDGVESRVCLFSNVYTRNTKMLKQNILQ